MTISLTKEEAALILDWVRMEHSDVAFAPENLGDEFWDDVRKNINSIEQKVKFAKMKESLKKATKRLNEINIDFNEEEN